MQSAIFAHDRTVFCFLQRVRAGLSSSDSTVAVLSSYVTQSHTSHVDMTSHRCDDVELQPHVNDVTSQELEASSMTSVYDNVALDEVTQLSTATSRSLTPTSPNHRIVRCDDRMSCRRPELFTVGDNRQTPSTAHTTHRSTVHHSHI